MGKSSPSAPAVPDPIETAQAQGVENRKTAADTLRLNMVNQYTPSGSLEYTQRGTTADGLPQYSATQTLSPEQQQIFDAQNRASIGYGDIANTQLGLVSDTLSTPIDFSTLGDAPQANEEMRQSVYDSIIQRTNHKLTDN